METKNILNQTIYLIFILTVTMIYPLIAADGFGGNATGGAGGTVVTVSNATDFTTYATATAAYIINVSGTIATTGNVLLKSNKTIQGVNSSATINGNLKLGSGVSNVIIQYLNITNTLGVGDKDGITILDGAKRVFITHCSFTDCADGMCDITVQADSVTVSWCRFRYVSQTTHKYVNLIGANDTHMSDLGRLHVTFHHNWYDQNCDERMPSVRFGRVHVYNNYYSSDSILYGTRTRLYAECLVENNYFEKVQNPWELAWSKAAGTVQGKLRAANNNISYLDTIGGVRWVDGWYEDAAIIAKLIPGTDDVFTPIYSYSPENALDVKSKVMAGAGNVLTPYTITASAGANGSIIPSGVTYVSQGSSLTCTIVPATGYEVDNVLVDGSPVGPVTSYPFTNITTNHTISASFRSSTCSYILTPSSAAYSSSGGTGNVNVSASAGGCAWTATSNAAWITITSGTPGVGNGSVGYSVAANSSSSARAGTMTIAGLTFTVSQSGVTCTYSLPSSSAAYPSSGGTGSANVTSASGCEWTAISNDAWITVTSGSSGSGSGSVGYSVAANSASGPRVGTLTIAGLNFNITQAGTATSIVDLVVGWNLISVPRVQINNNAEVVFPGKYGSMFGYNQVLGDYVEAPTLDIGLGYWVYYTTATAITINGDVAGTVQVTCKAGWHLIGSREREVLVADLQLSAGSIYGSAFRYDPGVGDYAETAVISPGQGIWIYVTQDCELTIP